MPKIFEYFGIVFYFYANEHLPIHVHAKSGDYETIFELIFENGILTEIRRRKSRGIEHLPPKILKEAHLFIEKYGNQIAQKWTDFFVLQKEVKSEKITQKL